MSEAPMFPNFRPLRISDRPIVGAITHPYPPYSDFNFASLFCWNFDSRVQWSLLENMFVIRFAEYRTGSLALSLIGNGDSDAAVNALMQFAESEGLPRRLDLVPEIVAAGLDSRRWDIKEEIDHHDYILDTDLVARSWRKLRQRSNNFWRRNPTCETTTGYLAGDRRTRNASLDLFDHWITNRQNAQYREERSAFERALYFAAELDLIATGIWSRDRLVALAILENLNHGWAMAHFSKADLAFDSDGYAALNREVCRTLMLVGVDYLNIEQDLGLPGLRTSKVRLHPVNFLKKFSIEG
jgi:uncharacterized protein